MIATVDVEGGQVPLDMVHWNTFVPTDKKFTADVGELGEVTTPLPDNNDQTPDPTAGAFAAIVAEETVAQMVWLGPATEMVGTGSRTIATVEEEGAQAPL